MRLIIKLILFAITYLFSGLITACFLKAILSKHKNTISPGEILISGFGLGPVIISSVLLLLFLFFPNKTDSFYILIVSTVFLLMLFIGRKNILNGKEFIEYLRKIRHTEKDIILIVAVVSVVILYIFILGINFPIIETDATRYAFNGKYLYQEKNLDNYPMGKPDEKTGAMLGIHHPPGFPLIYTWFYLLQGNTNSDILPRTVAPMYGLYLIILLWIVLKKRKNKYCAAFAVLLMALTPYFAKMSFDNTIDPIRIFLIFTSLIYLSKFIESESFIMLLLTGIIAGSCIYVHSGSVLAVAVMIVIWLLLYLLFSKKNIKRRMFLAFLLIIIVGGAIYGTKHTKLGRTVEPAYLSLSSALKPFSEPLNSKIAQFGTKWSDEVRRGQLGWLKRNFNERFQCFSRISIFGLSYYIFIIGIFYWMKYIQKKKLDIVLLLGAVLYGIPVIYKYRVNFRYIFTVSPMIIYFGGLSLGTIYGRLKEKRLWKISPILWIILFIGIIAGTTSLFIPASLFDSNYTKSGSAEKMMKYMFANQKQKLYSTHPTFEAIGYINTQTPKDSIVLVFRAPEYFYNAERKGIHPEGFYQLQNTEQAYNYLLNAGVDYIMVDPVYEESSEFKDSEFKNIIENKKFSQLVFGNYVRVYKLVGAQ